MVQNYTFQDLLDIMAKLRGENGCPWDREQSHDSLKKYILEEAYEVADAIEDGDKNKLSEELGDVLLQVVFHSTIGNEQGTFNINDVINSICQKLIHRHPHIFGDLKGISEASQVEQTWNEIKNKDKGLCSYTQGMKDIPKNFPSLMRSYKIQKKAAEVGFDWDNVEDAMKKVFEEIEEVKEAYEAGNAEHTFEELGDLLFAVVNVSRMMKVEPETALLKTINKFINRFEYVEQGAIKQNRDLKDMTLEEMDVLWNQSKGVLK